MFHLSAVEEDASGLAAAGLDPAVLAAGVRESDDGRDLLLRFVALARGAAHAEA